MELEYDKQKLKTLLEYGKTSSVFDGENQAEFKNKFFFKSKKGNGKKKKKIDLNKLFNVTPQVSSNLTEE